LQFPTNILASPHLTRLQQLPISYLVQRFYTVWADLRLMTIASSLCRTVQVPDIRCSALMKNDSQLVQNFANFSG